jgi:hypothetical protein
MRMIITVLEEKGSTTEDSSAFVLEVMWIWT